MPLDGELKHRLERALGVVDDHGSRGTRLLEDAHRLCARVRMLIARGLIPPETDSGPLEAAVLALQLPQKMARGAAAAGKLGRTNLRERAEQAAETLVGMVGNGGSEGLLDRTEQLLLQVHQRNPESDEARLLADVINLDDFGLTGLIGQAVSAARHGAGVSNVADGCEKREQYGYWEARLKDGFHFEQTRELARRRLEHARRAASLLIAELREDGAL